MVTKKYLISKLDDGKIKINWNKNPIRMDKFLSFLTVPVERTHDHLGSDNGWTQLVNKELDLIIGGGIIGGIEYLDKLLFGNRLSNPYNNFVNPFYLFDILSNDGKKFFVMYYHSDMLKLISDAEEELMNLQNALNKKKAMRSEMKRDFQELISI